MTCAKAQVRTLRETVERCDVGFKYESLARAMKSYFQRIVTRPSEKFSDAESHDCLDISSGTQRGYNINAPFES